MGTRKFRYNIIWLFFGVLFITYMDRVNLAVCGTTIMKEFGISPKQLGIVFSGFLMGYVLLNIPAGFIAQRFSYRKVLAVCMVLWSIMTAVTGFAGGIYSLLIIRVMFGAFEGPIPPGLPQGINDWFPTREKGMAVAIYVTGIPAGVMLGNIFTGYLLTAVGWRSVFYIMGGLGILFALVCWIVFRDKPAEHPWVSRDEAKLISSTYYTPSDKPVTGSTFGQVLASPWVWLTCLNWFCWAITYWSIMTWFPTYLVMARQTSILKSGVLASLPWGVGILGLLLMGKVSDMFGRGEKNPINGWGSIFGSIFIVIGVLTPSTTVCIICFCVAMFFIVGYMGNGAAAVMNTFHQGDVGKVMGFALACSSAGGVLAPIMIGYIFDVTKSFNIAYYVCAVSTFACGVTCLTLLIKERRELKLREELTLQKTAGQPLAETA